MAFNISYVYKAIDQFTPVANKIAAGVTRIKEKVDSANSSMKSFGSNSKISGMKISAAFTLPFILIGKSALKASAEIETMGKSFEVILGSAEKGQTLMADMKKLTLDTPYQLKQIGDSARILLASGIPMQDINEKVMTLGNVAAGANMPIENMVAIFAKVRNQGRAMAREINQLNKTPIRNILQAMFKHGGKGGKPISPIEFTKLISKGMISPEIFQAAINKMTAKGGIYHDKMKAMMETLAGKWSNFQDAVYLASGTMGDAIVKIFDLKTVLNDLSNWIIIAANKFKVWASVHPQLAKMIFYFTAFIGVLGPLLILIGLMSSGFALLLSPIGLIIIAIGALTSSALAFKPVGDVIRIIFHLTRIAVEQLGIGLQKLGEYFDNLFPKFELFSKLKNGIGKIGDFFSGGGAAGFADYLSGQSAYDSSKSSGINSGNGINQSMISGNIVVQAAQGTSILQSDWKQKGSNINLGQSMMGAY